jgi:FlaA1/EpsC-like NDP-sugar epimerase
MGEPVRIVDLAKDLVHLSGFEIGRDIDLVFTGLRPGEKFFEELFNGDETFKRTTHDKIFVAKNGSAPKIPAMRLDRLYAAVEAGDVLRIRQHLAEVVPAYMSETSSARAANGGNGKRGKDTGAAVRRTSAEAQ